MKPLTKLMTAALGVTLALTGCAGESTSDESQCRGAKCDDLDKPDSEIEDSPCDGIMNDLSGRGNGKVAGRLNDPVAQMVFRNGNDCPATFEGIMQKLRENDTEGCSEDNPRAGISTRVVTETAQAVGAPTSYRAVTSRTCDGRSKHGILFSLFGVRAGAENLPGNVEIMAFDEVNGHFNYYETDGQSINFFGTSKDMLKGKGQGQERRCAQCHDGGGLVMKELDTPWLHWEGHMDTPGAAELVQAHESLGTKASGAEFEGLVKAGNRVWNEKRVEFARAELDTRELLKPLFCTVEVNLDNGADFESPVDGKKGVCSNDENLTCNEDTECGGEDDRCNQQSIVTRINADALVAPNLKSFGSISISHDDYQALLASTGSRIQGINGSQDTVFDMPYIERSHADTDYLEKLKAAGIVDDALIKDVLMVDFTRPIFSDDRCDLLSFVPLLPAADATADNIRSGLIANLGNPAADSPAKELKNNLLNDENHQATVDAFFDACGALDQSTFLTNAYTIISGNRNKARELHVFEFPQTMPTDNLNAAPGQRLHPTTCEITTDFVKLSTDAVGGGGGEEPPPPPAMNPCGFETHAAQENGFTPSSADVCQCVTTICDADSFCCENNWDNICAEAAQADTANCPATPTP